jgi:hypothetical protein
MCLCSRKWEGGEGRGKMMDRGSWIMGLLLKGRRSSHSYPWSLGWNLERIDERYHNTDGIACILSSSSSLLPSLPFPTQTVKLCK